MQLREASGSILYVSFGFSNVKKQVWKYILETVGDLILILVGCLHQPFMDLILNHQQPRKICYEPAALTLPPGNDVCVLLNCFPNYMVMGNVIAGWIMFRSNRGNIYSPHWTHSEVVGVDGGHRKFRTVAWCIKNTVVRLVDWGMMSVFAKAFLTNYMIAADLLSPVGREQEHPWIWPASPANAQSDKDLSNSVARSSVCHVASTRMPGFNIPILQISIRLCIHWTDLWRPRHWSDLALTKYGRRTSGVSGTRAMAAHPLSPVSCEGEPP